MRYSTPLNLMLVVIASFSLGALASPIAQSNDCDSEYLAQRATNGTVYSNTRWTWYDVDTGSQVSCGGFYHNTDAIVALSGQNMQSSLCGKTIKMTYGKVTTTAKIVDTCPGCPSNGLDLSKGLFQKFASEDVGVLSGSWEFV